MPRLLVTGFEPFGLYGQIFNKNPSRDFAIKLKERYPSIDLLILPVNDDCIEIMRANIKALKPDLIFMMGLGDVSTRIETVAHRGCNKLQSAFAKAVKERIGDIEYESIGDWYCNDIYYEALCQVPESVFIHLSYLPDFESIRKVFEYCIQKKSLYIGSDIDSLKSSK